MFGHISFKFDPAPIQIDGRRIIDRFACGDEERSSINVHFRSVSQGIDRSRFQCARVDRGGAREAIVAGKGERVARRAVHENPSRSADDPGVGLVGTAGVQQGAPRVAHDVASVIAATHFARSRDGQGATIDRGVASISVVAGKGECVAAVLREPAGAADRSADRDVAGGGVDGAVDAEAQGMRSLYVALTRATQRLTVVHARALPAPMIG